MLHRTLRGRVNAINRYNCVCVCVAFRYKLKVGTNLLGLFQFILWLDRNKTGTSCMLTGPFGQTERALCHIHRRQTPNSLKLCIFLLAVRHCLKRMERLQCIMRSCGCFLSLLVFYSYVCLFDFSFLLRSLLRFIVLSWFHSVFFCCSSFQSLFLSSLSFFFSSGFLISLFLLVVWNYSVLNWTS